MIIFESSPAENIRLLRGHQTAVKIASVWPLQTCNKSALFELHIFKKKSEAAVIKSESSQRQATSFIIPSCEFSFLDF